jgi:hypothetical protein
MWPGQLRQQARALRKFIPLARDLCKIFFQFQIQFNSSSNFGNLYLFEYRSKIYETSSVGFVISSSIHKKYKTKQ